MAKIVFISDMDETPWGGSEVLWSQTAIYLAEHTNHSIVVFAKYWQDEPIHYQQMKQAGCRIVYRSEIMNRLDILKQPLITNITQNWQQRYQYRQWKLFLQQESPHLIILSVGNHNSGYLWTETARQLNIPYALILQLVKEGVVPADDHLNRINKHYFNAKQIYCVSKQNQRSLQIQCSNLLTNSSVVFNPIPKVTQTTFFYPDTCVYNIACVARLSVNHKAQDILLQVLALDKWRQRNLILNLYGGGRHKEYVRRLANFLSLENVNFCGFVEDKSQIWSTNHALILPSKMEGMSLALLEAMSYGRVVITTDVGGATEVIDDNISGFVGTYSSVELLDKLLERAWAKRNDWQKMGQLAQDKISKILASQPIKNLADSLITLIKE